MPDPAVSPPAHRASTPPPAENWKPGDLAECINTGLWYRDGLDPVRTGPNYAETRMVRQVIVRRHPLGGWVQTLVFDAWPRVTFCAHAFRKITPRADAAIAHDARFLDRWLPAREPA